jgi:hypothetical protein
MTQDEIFEMAEQAEFCISPIDSVLLPKLEAFAKLVADKKQEDIIKAIERLGTWAHIEEVVNAIRGEQA